MYKFCSYKYFVTVYTLSDDHTWNCNDWCRQILSATVTQPACYTYAANGKLYTYIYKMYKVGQN